jgi:hypothetical protein
MKPRLDLLEHLKAEDILEEVLANNHRYKAEPLLSKTGVGSLKTLQRFYLKGFSAPTLDVISAFPPCDDTPGR